MQAGLWFGLAMSATVLAGESGSSACRDSVIGRVVVTADGLQIDESFAEGLRPDDILIQLNGRALRTCADLTQAAAEARAHQLALLLLVRQANEMRAIVLQPPETATAKPLAAAAVAELPKPTPTAFAIAPSEAATVGEMVAQLGALGRAMQGSLPLLTSQPWARHVSELRRTYDDRQAATPAIRAVEPILDEYQTVGEILIYKEAAARAAGNTRPQPNVTLPYNTGSQVSAWLRRHPFLQGSVVEPPEKTAFAGWGEGNGLWSPDRAVELLVEQALADGDALAGRVAGTKTP